MHRSWEGWDKVDRREFDDVLKDMVKDFYRKEFWDRVYGDVIGFQEVAQQLFDFAVNAGLKTSIRMCQRIIGAPVDGIFGDKTLKALNAFIQDEKDAQLFVLTFSLMKIFRYKNIVMDDPNRGNLKFLCGWINRVEAGL